MLMVITVFICASLKIQAREKILYTENKSVLQEENGSIETEEIQEIKESTLYAQSAVLMDAQTGRVLYEKNGSEVLPMASTTKIMTLLIALEEGKMDDIVTVSSYAAGMPDVQLGMKEGEQYYFKDLLYSLMLESHNDTAVAIAEHVAGDIESFAGKMNRKAKEIGCENTTFITPNGLDATATLTESDGIQKEVIHSTTAQDLAKILSYCVAHSEHKDTFLEITQTPSYTFSDCSKKRSFSCRNHNSFLYMMEGAISGKTGFTGKAGYCYAGALKRDDKTFVVALLACGWPNNRTYKWKDTKKLMEYGIDHYEYSYFKDASAKIPRSGEIEVIGGQTEKIGEKAYVKWEVKEAAGTSDQQGGFFKLQKAAKDLPEGILLRKDEKIDLQYEIDKNVQAPVNAGDCIGYIRYLVGEEVYKEEKLILQSGVERIDYDWCLKKVTERFFIF